MNLDKYCHCPKCSEPMLLQLPIWIRPGEQHINTGDGAIDWESGNRQHSQKWYCETCESHHFPLDNERLVRSYDGNRDYPFMIVKRTSCTAIVVKCDVDGDPLDKPHVGAIDYETHGEPVIHLNDFETVYLDQDYEVQQCR